MAKRKEARRNFANTSPDFGPSVMAKKFSSDPDAFGNAKHQANDNNFDVARRAILLVLTGAYSHVTQLSMSPVYGSIPALLYHGHMKIFCLICSSLLAICIAPRLTQKLIKFIPIVALAIPILQAALYRRSFLLGPLWGPIITEALTLLPLLSLSALATESMLRRYLHSLGRFSAVGSGVLTYGITEAAERLFTSLLSQVTYSTRMVSRIALQYQLAAAYSFLLPSKLLLLSVPSLYHAAFYNIHSPLAGPQALLNTTLQSQSHYSLLARTESVTGYVAVLENMKDQFRVLRCDHSLLGGEWLQPPDGFAHTSGIREPIYAVFAMLEAVRLVIPGDSGRSNAANLSIEAGGRTEEQALVIGLGIGTASTALTAHGIKTTTVELDPAVVRYATQYFGLPSNHTSVVEDAMTFVDKSRRTETELAKYDYIIHDVFTGGAEPVELFSWDFLKKLRDLLKPNGVIAINYAGDLAMPSASWVVETIQSIYPACRIFREDQAPTEPVVQDFTNLVIFCSNSGRQIAFRDPVEADFLGSHARRHYLLPRYEVESQQLETTRERFAKESVSPNLEKWQRQSAVGHWSIMRTVMPDAVWENW